MKKLFDSMAVYCALLMVCALDALVSLLSRCFGYRFGGTIALANISEGTHVDGITKLTDAAIATRFLVGKTGSDADHVAVAASENDKPLGIIEDEAAAAEANVMVAFLGSAANRTRRGVASEAIAFDADVYNADNGKLQNLPVPAGTYFKIGRAMQAASADGDVIEFEPQAPEALVIP